MTESRIFVDGSEDLSEVLIGNIFHFAEKQKETRRKSLGVKGSVRLKLYASEGKLLVVTLRNFRFSEKNFLKIQ